MLFYSAFGPPEGMTLLPPAVCCNSTSSPVARQTLESLRSGRLHIKDHLILYSRTYHCSYLPSITKNAISAKNTTVYATKLKLLYSIHTTWFLTKITLY